MPIVVNKNLNASDCVNGVKFALRNGVMVSVDDVTGENLALFEQIPGFYILDSPAPGAMLVPQAGDFSTAQAAIDGRLEAADGRAGAAEARADAAEARIGAAEAQAAAAEQRALAADARAADAEAKLGAMLEAKLGAAAAKTEKVAAAKK